MTLNLTSRFTQHLYTNYVPTEKEMLEINGLLIDPLSRLAKLNAEIERIQSMLQNLQEERDSLVQTIQPFKALLSPIRRLPQDLIEEIFVHCLPISHDAIMSATEMPLLLGRVSSNWRAISLTMPRLWSSLHIPVPASRMNYVFLHGEALGRETEEKLTKRIEAVSLWLSRSGEHPLSFTLTVPDRAFNPSNHDNFVVLFQTLLSYRHRWRKVQFIAPFSCLRVIVTIPNAEEELPSLESLKIELGPQYDTSFDDQPVDNSPLPVWIQAHGGIFRAPKLSKLFFINVKQTLCQIPLYLSLTEIWLEETHGSGMGIQDAATLLRAFPGLVSCSLEIQSPRNTDDQIDTDAGDKLQIIPLHHLQSLTVKESLDDITSFFECLEVPNLSNLEYRRVAQYRDEIGEASILPLLSRYGETVRSLTLNSRGFSTESILKCLKHVTKLVSLKLLNADPFDFWGPQTNSALNNYFLDCLTPLNLYNPHSPCLLPSLERFECDVDAAFSDTALVTLIRSRSGVNLNKGSGIAQLKFIRVIFNRGEQINMVSHMEEFVKAGMKIDIKHLSRTPRGEVSPWDGLPYPLADDEVLNVGSLGV